MVMKGENDETKGALGSYALHVRIFGGREKEWKSFWIMKRKCLDGVGAVEKV